MLGAQVQPGTAQAATATAADPLVSIASGLLSDAALASSSSAYCSKSICAHGRAQRASSRSVKPSRTGRWSGNRHTHLIKDDADEQGAAGTLPYVVALAELGLPCIRAVRQYIVMPGELGAAWTHPCDLEPVAARAWVVVYLCCLVPDHVLDLDLVV